MAQFDAFYQFGNLHGNHNLFGNSVSELQQKEITSTQTPSASVEDVINPMLNEINKNQLKSACIQAAASTKLSYTAPSAEQIDEFARKLYKLAIEKEWD